ncbi:MAG: class II aldolase/adducin family protein [Candidatus Micrarchaeia archaeon]
MEEYVGVKFAIGENALKRGRCRDRRIMEMITYGKMLAALGFVKGNEGNMSIRKRMGMIVTASGSSLSNLTYADFVHVKEFSFESFTLLAAVGLKNPSSETPMHLLAYKTRRDVGAVIHVHSMIGGSAVVGACPYGSMELAISVANKLRENDVVMMEGHGSVVVGKNVRDAFMRILYLREERNNNSP